MSDSNAPTIAPPSKLSLIKLALPTIIGNISLSFVALIAIGFVDELGENAQAAVIAADRIYFAIQAIIIGITVGTTAMVANAFGAKDYVEADSAIKLSLMLAIGLSIVIAIIVEFAAPWLIAIIKMENNTHDLATAYLKILVYFNVCFAYVAITSAALRAAGDAITPVVIGIAGNLLAVFFTYGLIFGKFGLPQLGLMGAAYAVGLSMLFVGVVIHILWFSKRLLLQPQRQSFLSKARFRHLLNLSLPSIFEQLIFNSALLGFVIVISLYSEAAYTAYGIGINILSLSIFIGFGFALATGTIVGQYLGANQPEEAVKATWHSLRWAMGLMVCIAIALCFGARRVGSLIISDPETLNYLVALVFVMATVQPLMAIEYALSGALRGAGDTKTTASITSAGFFLGRVLLTAIFYFSGLSVYWIYAALIGDYVVKAGLYILAFNRGGWKTAFADSKRRAQGATVVVAPEPAN